MGKSGGEAGFRGFVAVALPDEIRTRCARLSEALRPAPARVAWVRPANLHLTLRFLGNTRPPQVKRLVGSLAHKALKLSPFDVELAGLGAFPSPRRPRIIWVGVGEGADQLANLAAKVEGAAVKAGFPREARAFSPHLTLGRVKMARRPPGKPSGRTPAEGAPGEDWRTLLARSDPGSLGRFPVGEIVLFESRLTPGGTIHTPLHRVKLGRQNGPAAPAKGA